MRVLLTTDTIGGVWTFTKELSEGLLAAGHQVALMSFGRSPSSAQSAWCTHTAQRYSAAFRYHFSEVPLEWMQQNEGVFGAGTIALQSAVRDFSPDVFHSSQFCWGALPLGIPTLITAHSDVLSWAEAANPQALTGSPWLDRYRKLVQSGLDGADAVVAPSQWMLQALHRNFAVPCRSEVIYNGRAIPPSHPSAPGRKLQAVTTGRLWDEGKGLSSLLKVALPMPLMLAGDDSFGSASAVLPSAVKALGHLDEPELLGLFQQSSVYIAPSLYEPFGLAPLEAGLCGCAVLARELDSLREIWEDAALYFRNSIELEATLRRLSNPSFLLERQLVTSARARQFTAQRMTSLYLTLYQSLLQDRATPCGSIEDHAAYAL